MMTRKHFEKLAAANAKIGDEAERERQAQRLADALAGENPRFDRQKFLRKATGG
jgi:hypothetical protein